SRAGSGRYNLQLDDLNAFFGSALPVKLAYALRHRPDLAIADEAIVDLSDTREFAHGAGAEYFVRAVNIHRRQVCFDAPDFFGGADFDYGCACDSFRTRNDVARLYFSGAHDENVS